MSRATTAYIGHDWEIGRPLVSEITGSRCVGSVTAELDSTESRITMCSRTEQLTVRDAAEADLPALTAVKPSESLHRDRLQEAQGAGFRYLVLLRGQEIIGFACLVFRRPASWSDAKDTQHLPQIVDLRVADSQRGRGYGSAFLRAVEQETARAGYKQLYLAVEPVDNPRAYALYQRLGYQPLQSEPYRKVWEFSDSGGNRHHGEQWIVDMVKPL